MPDVGRGHRNVFREASITIDTDDFREWTHVRVPRPAQQTPAVDDVAFGSYAVAFLDIRNEPTDLQHVTSELVSDDEWLLAAPLCPRVPVVDVDIGSAHTGSPHSYQHFVFAD